jgi:hypothetical protein
MTYKSFPYPTPKPDTLPSPPEQKLKSIPNTTLPKIQIFDNVVGPELHKELFEYINKQLWHQVWLPVPGELQVFRPNNHDTSWINAASITRKLGQPRALLASDDTSLKKKHEPVWRLWQEINNILGGDYAITGIAEGMHWKEYPCPKPEDPDLATGWRVYCNASMHDFVSGSGYVHRDNPELEDEDSVTILWVANPEWYPSWGGEIMFYPEDPNGATGDHQQFNAPAWTQRPGQSPATRGFKIGWQDDGKMVTFRPNRLVVYDGRTLHSTSPTRHRYNSEPNQRIVFRARKIKKIPG